jgi:hypothetical protein
MIVQWLVVTTLVTASDHCQLSFPLVAPSRLSVSIFTPWRREITLADNLSAVYVLFLLDFRYNSVYLTTLYLKLRYYTINND